MSQEIKRAIMDLSIKITNISCQRMVIEQKRKVLYPVFNTLADFSLGKKSGWLKRCSAWLACKIHFTLNKLLQQSIDLLQEQLNLTKKRRKLENALQCLNYLKTTN